MNRETWGRILEAPLILLVVSAFLASIYATFKGIQNISWASPIILGIVIVLYIIGWRLGKIKNEEKANGRT